LTLVGLIGLYSVWRDPLLHLDQGADLGPAFFPMTLLILLAAGGALLTVGDLLRARRAGGVQSDPEFTPKRLFLPAVLALSLVLYNLAIPVFGYLPTTIAFAVVWLPFAEWADTGRTPGARTLPRYLIEAVLIGGILYAGFRYGINVPLP
jgi:hypothetical protein